MRHTNNKLTLGMLVLLLLFSPIICLGYDSKSSDNTPDKAMMLFINVMVHKDINAVLAFFPEKVPCKRVFYGIGTTKPLYTNYILYRELGEDFKNKKELYNSFFDEPNGYTYLANFDRNVMWKRKGRNTFVHPESDFGTTYIKWKRIDGKWVISEIGDTGP